MRIRFILSNGLPTAILIVIALCAFVHTSAGQGSTSSRVERREYPDDPPGKLAGPLPRAVPATPLATSSATIVQANVASGGANIVGDAANEPSIAVDPNYPNRMAIGWRQFNTVASNFREAGYAFSIDGGRTWTFPGTLDAGTFRSDPVLGFDSLGRFYYLSLRVNASDYWCEMFKSFDQGATWSPPAYAYGGDKAWMTIDRTGGMGDGNVYTAWSIAAGCCNDSTFNRSTDGGTHFSVPQVIPNNPVWGTLAVGADGALYVAGADPNTLTSYYCAKSTNAQDPMATPAFDFVASVDLGGGMAFGYPSSPNPGGLLGQISIAVDASGGPYDGYVYMLCSVTPPGTDPLDVHFVRSTDGGLTWSTPVRVNDDAVGTDAWQWFGTMSVAPNGRIDVIWNDTRFGATFRESVLMYSYSTDGGATWSANSQISPLWDSFLGFPNQNKIGDYYDMISDDVGAHLAWAATFNGEQDVYYTRINDYDCNGNGVGDAADISMGTSLDVNANGIPDECEAGPTAVTETAGAGMRLFANVPNPFNPETVIRYQIPEGGSDAALRIYDVSGRLVRTLADGRHAAGENSVSWDGRDDGGMRVASGVYFYRLTAPDFTQTRKMVLLK